MVSPLLPLAEMAPDIVSCPLAVTLIAPAFLPFELFAAVPPFDVRLTADRLPAVAVRVMAPPARPVLPVVLTLPSVTDAPVMETLPPCVLIVSRGSIENTPPATNLMDPLLVPLVRLRFSLLLVRELIVMLFDASRSILVPDPSASRLVWLIVKLPVMEEFANVAASAGKLLVAEVLPARIVI